MCRLESSCGVDYDGRTALHIASSEGNLGIVKYLIEQGVDPNPVDRWGGSPIDDAVRHKKSDVAEFLRRRGGSFKSDEVD